MKKFAFTILALIYLSTSIGVTVHMHYCMDKIAEWGLSNKESNTCSKCEMEQSGRKDKDCCKDKLTYFKITEDQKVVETAIQLAQQMTFIVPTHYFELPTRILAIVIGEKLMGDSPPFKYRVPIYILNCDYRI